MNRLHVHLKVKDIAESVGFYSALFGRKPDRQEADYAKWLLDDPAANISISARGGATGVDHVGLQTDNRDALGAIAARLKDAGAEAVEESDATCCYARSNKYWAHSPDGAVWELFQTFGDSKTYGDNHAPQPRVVACCAP